MSYSGLYKDTVSDLNQANRELWQFYAAGDLRAAYLRTFEGILSQSCKNKMLWQFKCYRKLAAADPLPESQRAYVTPATWWNYMMVYEQIMRKVDLIDKMVERREDQTEDVPLFDPEAD